MKTGNYGHFADQNVLSEAVRFEAPLQEPTLNWLEPEPGGTVPDALGGSIVALTGGLTAWDEAADLPGVAG